TEKPEKLIKSGPYAIIRHPLYLGLILLCMGGVIASSSKLLIIPFLINLVVIIKKVKTEEELLESLPEFKEYKSRTWKLIPFLW
ncbi:MAG: isoprenylcysteine carboxylmethyltransferase family protein, partial [Clostridia bacterium]|nr:isoprenylcysteine carboxylmethyltransferase family protein [Clostridia bacterium]